MYKESDEPSTASIKNKLYEFASKNIQSALRLAYAVGTKKGWRVVLIAEVNQRISQQSFEELREEVGLE